MFRPLRSLQGRILSAFVVGWLAMLVVMVLVAFFVARDSLRETISENLLTETRLTALGLDDYLLTRQRHRQGEMPLSLMMMDLDHFKPVNDSAGHAAGDEMLRSIGELLIETVRDSDSVARLGGDEFAILLPACPLVRARDVAERLREAIGRLDFKAGQHRFRVTMSIGIAMLGEADRSLPAFLQRVDQACYRAKRLGRNRVVVHDGDRVVASPES